uniref:C1q domain-containing protein n=1 Tax=Knipowitschia caucasica TaxID=637954 RepID=A0AAV2IZ77_KNICA
MRIAQPTLVVILVVITLGFCAEAKTTPKPKYQYTKKPAPQVTMHKPATTSKPKTLKIVVTPSPTPAQPPPIMEGTTFPNHGYPPDYNGHTDTPGNYTLDYNECYFNFCECCPPEPGPRGQKGDGGLTGPPGEKGLSGSPGLPGSPGQSGPIGLRGDKGDKGDRGNNGQNGLPGILGKPGQKGDVGSKGEKGDIGLQGVNGEVGAKGEAGVNGTAGERGEPGKDGPPGPIGPGPKGDKGDTGECGTFGERGTKVGGRGDPGIPGPKGEPGLRGPQGPQGMRFPGPKGDRGYPGMRGERGMRGFKGAKGTSIVLRRSAFSVGISPRKSFPPSGFPVRFDKIFYNEENHFNTTTNSFTCVHAGVYVFSFHITVRNQPLRATLVVNGSRKVRIRDSLYGQDIDQASTLVVLQLNQGDQVWVETLRDWNGVYASTEDDSIFSGFLLYPNSV